MFKNTASQKITVFAYDYSTGAPKTGDGAQLTVYVSKDDGAVTALGDTSATELDSTNAKGLYAFDVTQTETNADKLVFSGKSSTGNVTIIPITIFTRPPNMGALSIDSNGKVLLVTTPPTATENADALLKRDMSAVTGESARSPLNALRFLRNKWSITGATLTVTKEDDSTSAWTSTLVTTAGNPVSSSDPA